MISNWDTSKVTNMRTMFYYASVFNQDISNWNVSSCSNFTNMFCYASVFNQDIGNWKLRSAGATMTNMFSNASAWSTQSAQKTLIGWANYVSSSWNGKSSGTPSSIALDISPRVLTDNVYNVHPYTDSGVVIPFTNSKEAKNYLVSQGWTITTG